MVHQEVGYDLANQIIELLGDNVVVEQKPVIAGRNLSIVVRSNNNAKVKNP